MTLKNATYTHTEVFSKCFKEKHKYYKKKSKEKLFYKLYKVYEKVARDRERNC